MKKLTQIGMCEWSQRLANVSITVLKCVGHQYCDRQHLVDIANKPCHATVCTATWYTTSNLQIYGAGWN